LGVTDEAKATATASVAILDDYSFLDGSKFLELLAQCILIGVPRQSSNKELRHVAG